MNPKDDKLNWETLIKHNWYDDNIYDTTKRFYVFGYNQYYPSGGLEDIRGTFDNLKEAFVCAKNTTDDYVTIFDRQQGSFIKIR